MQIYGSEKESEKIITHQKISNGIAAFGAFVVLIVTLIASNYANDNIIRILLVIILFILIIELFGVKQNLISYFEKKEHDKLAKSHFEEFKKIVLRFDKFTDQNRTNIRKVIVEIKENQEIFSNIHILELTLFDQLYEFYKVHLNQFNGTKVSLVALAKEFENILLMYNNLQIQKPIEEIRKIGSDKVDTDYKNKFNINREDYINFITSYKNFADDANNDFDAREFKDYFDSPNKL